MATRYCGDAKIELKYSFASDKYRARILCAKGGVTLHFNLNELLGWQALDLGKPDAPESYDHAATMALSLMVNLPVEDERYEMVQAIQDALVSGLHDGKFHVRRQQFPMFPGEVYAAM